jgi:hypothetical protein
MIEQPTLPFDPAAIPGERSIRSDHAMTRNNHRHRVGSIREPDSPYRSRTPDALSKLPIRNSRAAGNRPQCLPDLALKRSATRLNGQRIENAKLSREVARKSIGKAEGIPRSLKQKSVRAKLANQLPPHRFLVLSKKSEAQAPRRIAHNHHRANGRSQPVEQDVDWVRHHRRSENRYADSFTPTNQAQTSEFPRVAASLFPTPDSLFSVSLFHCSPFTAICHLPSVICHLKSVPTPPQAPHANPP